MKTTLIAVSGMSPAILTETLWALAGETPAIVPEEIVVITTSKGEADIRRDLLTKQEAWKGATVWEMLRRDIFALTGAPKNSTALQLSIRVIELPNPETGVREPAEDLRTRSHNDEAADFILRTVSSLTESADTRVIASIAGGRKTMGALLYAAMTLVGRESDRVTHVLVSPPYETCRGFFYPAQPAKKLEAFDPTTRTTSPINAKDAMIELSDIPFVPLRNGFAELNEPKLSFPGLVRRYSVELKSARRERPMLGFDPNNSVLMINKDLIHLPTAAFRVTHFLYERLDAGESHFKGNTEACTPFVDFCKEKYGVHLEDGALKNGLNELRAALRKNDMDWAVDYLARVNNSDVANRRVGFDAEIADLPGSPLE